MPVTVKLSKPLTTHKGEVTDLVFRDMTARDLVTTKKDPVTFTYINNGKGINATTETRAETNYDVVMALASMLCGVEEAILGDVSAKDFAKVKDAVNELWRASGE